MPTKMEKKIAAMLAADEAYRFEIDGIVRDIRMQEIEIASLRAHHRKTLMAALDGAGSDALPLFEVAGGSLPQPGNVGDLPPEVDKAMKAVQKAYETLHELLGKRRNKEICRAHKLWQCMSSEEIRALREFRRSNGGAPPQIVEVYESLVDNYGDGNGDFNDLVDGKPSIKFQRADDGRYRLYVRAKPADQLFLGQSQPDGGGGPYT